jgi:hypothetical protein
MLGNTEKNVDENYMNKIPLSGKVPKCSGWTNERNFAKHNALAEKSEYFGILTGQANNIVVFDYDTKKDGENKGLVVDCDGKVYDLPLLRDIFGESAYIVKTKSGGFHIYCKLADDSPGQTTGVKGCMDVRNHNGYVVGAGSPGYEVVNGDITNLVEVPDSIKAICKQDSPVKRKERATKAQITLTKADQKFVKEILEAEGSGGFTNVSFPFRNSPYNFTCGEMGKKCPLCPHTHDSNCYYYYLSDSGELIVKNHSSKCVQKVFNDYPVLKFCFEKRVARINDEVMYVSDDGHKINIYNKSRMLERYNEWGRGKFVERWLLDPAKRQYRTMDFHPQDCPTDVYNTWKPYAVELIDPALGKKGTTKPFMDLLNALTAGDTKYALDYLAFLFQEPNKKPRTALVFKGLMGDGKGRLMYALSLLMGKELYFETSNADQDVFGQYARAYNRTKLVVLNESDAKTNFKHADRLKALITDEDGLNLREPYVPPYSVRNLAGLIICTNQSVPLLVTEDDRRVALYHTQPTYRNNQEFFTMFMDWAIEPENQRALYDELMARNLSKIDWVEDRPKNEAYLEVRNMCLPPIIKWLEHFIIEDFPANYSTHRGIKSTDLKYNYQHWNTREERVSDASFGLKMKKLKDDYHLPEGHLEGKHTNKGKFWFFDREGIFNWLVEKGFTRYEGETLPVPVDNTIQY